MRISTCQISRLRQAAGFTLIEILVVMLIVSVMMGIVVVRLPAVSQSAELTEDSERLLTILNMASDEAIIKGAELGFDIEKGSYQFYEMDSENGKWDLLEYSPFNKRQLSKGVRINIRVEGRSLLKDPDSTIPSVLFLSSGETTEAEIDLVESGSNSSLKITSDGVSGFKLDVPGESSSRRSGR